MDTAEFALEEMQTLIQIGDVDYLDLMAKKHGVTPQVLFYRWVVSDGVICPLNGTKSSEHMKQDVDVFKVVLKDDECQAIADVVYRDL